MCYRNLALGLQEVIPSNYISYCNDRKSHGGGVLAAVEHKIHATAISKPDCLEAISLHLHLHIPSIPTALKSPRWCLTYLILQPHPAVVGDFNLPDIDWDTLSAVSHSSEIFCDFVVNINLTQLIDKPTHVKGNILDLIVTNTSHRIQEIYKYKFSQPLDALRSLYYHIQSNPLCTPSATNYTPICI